MEKLILELPTYKREKEALAYIKEFRDYNSNINGAGNLGKADDYKKWVDDNEDFKKGVNLPEGYVPGCTYFAVRESDNKIVGMINLRYGLNDYLKSIGGGHIGNSVRPTERKKGYGTKILSLGLENLYNLGIDVVHIGCADNNIASRKQIEKNGGIFYERKIKGDKTILEYTVNVKEKFGDKKALK